MAGDAQVGIYSAAYRLSDPLNLISNALVVSLFPIMSTTFIKSEEKFTKIYKLSMKYILIIMLPIAVGVTLMADKIIYLIYGSDFKNSASALQIVIWSILFTSMNVVVSHLLISSNLQRLVTLSMTSSAILNVLLNFVMIPVLGYIGAAIATVITKSIMFLVNFYFASRNVRTIPFYRILAKPLLGAFIMGIFIHSFSYLNLWVVIFLSCVIYFISLIIIKTFSEEDLDIAKKAILFLK
jgi:O-antigen/teichoic acid export membrane protein